MQVDVFRENNRLALHNFRVLLCILARGEGGEFPAQQERPPADFLEQSLKLGAREESPLLIQTDYRLISLIVR